MKFFHFLNWNSLGAISGQSTMSGVEISQCQWPGFVILVLHFQAVWPRTAWFSPLSFYFLNSKVGCCMLGRLVVSNSLWSHGLQPTRLLSPWNSPGTGVCWYSLLQGVFLTQESNSHLVHWQANSLPLSHQGSVTNTCMGLIMSPTTPNSYAEELTPPAPQNVKFIFCCIIFCSIWGTES